MSLKLPFKTVCEAIDQLPVEEKELLVGGIFYAMFLHRGGMNAYVAKNEVRGHPFFLVAAFGPRAKELEEVTARWVEQGFAPLRSGQ